MLLPFFIVPMEGLWGVGIKRPKSFGIKIPTSHSFRVGWHATLIGVNVQQCYHARQIGYLFAQVYNVYTVYPESTILTQITITFLNLVIFQQFSYMFLSFFKIFPSIKCFILQLKIFNLQYYTVDSIQGTSAFLPISRLKLFQISF